MTVFVSRAAARENPLGNSWRALRFPRLPNASSGIVWALDTSGYASSAPAILRAYDATNLATKLFSSPANATDPTVAGLAVKFAVPTVANGKVYVGTQGELSVFGLVQ